MSFDYHLKYLSNEEYFEYQEIKDKNLIEKIRNQEKDSTIQEVYIATKYIGNQLLFIGDITQDIIDESKAFFKIKKTQLNLINNYGNEMFLIDKKALKTIIEIYNTNAQNKYTKLVKILEEALILDTDKKSFEIKQDRKTFSSLQKLKHTLEQHLFDFGGGDLLEDSDIKYRNHIVNDENISLQGEQNLIICNSEFYEYEKFNLVNIYNNFDWDNNTLFIYGG